MITTMARRLGDLRLVARGGVIDRNVYGLSARCARSRFLYLSLVGSLIAGTSAAQSPLRLTVRPREMATATQTLRAGMDSLAPDAPEFGYAHVYVPPQCVGTRRCPLVVSMQASGSAQLADKYGMIFLRLSTEMAYGLRDEVIGQLWRRQLTIDPGVPYLLREEKTSVDQASKVDDSVMARVLHEERTNAERATRSIDSAMKWVLHKYAIDPERIALTGNSIFGGYSVYLGCNNLDVFSRVAPTSPGGECFRSTGPTNETVQFYLTGGTQELIYVWSSIEIAHVLRQAGHRVKTVLEFRAHHRPTDVEYDPLLRWLQESWTTPGTATPAVPPALVDSLPLLTTETLTQWTTFWTRFMAEPDSIRTTARLAHQKEGLVSVGQEWLSLWMMDMSALATKYRSIAAALAEVGLTAQQAEAYRLALLSARIAQEGKNLRESYFENYRYIEPIEPASVLGKNVAFFDAHPEMLQVLEAKQMWDTP